MLAGLGAAAVTWLLVRSVLAARDQAKTEAERGEASLIRPKAEREAVAERRAQQGLSRLLQLAAEARQPLQVTPAASTADGQPETTAQTGTMPSPVSPNLARAPTTSSASTTLAQGVPLAPQKTREEILARPIAVIHDLGGRPEPESAAPSVAPPPVSSPFPPATPEVGPPLPSSGPAAIQPASPPYEGRSGVTPTARWVPPGEETQISGTRIASGMIYVGQRLPAQGGGDDRCLINPDLPVAKSSSGPDVPYWPSYAHMQPSARRAYIDWLASGRKDPGIHVGYVYLFLHGLERRLFLDRAIVDAPGIIAEVRRLAAVYESHYTFREHAAAFLGAARLLLGDTSPPRLEPITGYLTEIPFSTRVHLGRILAAGLPIDAEAAMLWVLGVPETRLRTSGQRCFEVLKRLWVVRFNERSPGGLIVRAPQIKIKAVYQSSNRSFEVDLSSTGEPLPDIAAVSAPLQGLRDLLEACMTELDPYSRLLGRRPEARETLEAIMLLPSAIRARVGASTLAAISSRIDDLLGNVGMATTTPRDVAHLLGVVQQPGSSLSGLMTGLSLMLDELDIGMEPDRRYGGGTVNPDTKVVLFRGPRGAPITSADTGYEAARLHFEISILAAASDGSVSPMELEALTLEVRRHPKLAEAYRLRLEAYVRALAGEPPRLQAALKKAAALPTGQRSAIAGAAVGAVLADGRAGPDEIKFLERLHKGLQLPPEAVHAALHQRAALQDEPVAVAAEDLPPDIPLPSEPSASPKLVTVGLRLDAGRLARIRAETSSVSALLADVFAEEKAAAPTEEPRHAAPSRDAAPSPYDGLGSAEGHLLAWVVGQGGRVLLGDLETEARRLRLLSGGAMENINEWGFERFDETVLEEEEDEVVVSEDLLPKLKAN